MAFLFRRRLSRQPLVGLRVAVFALVWHLIWIRFHEILLRPSGAESALYRTTIPGRWGGFSSPAIRMEQEPGSAGAAVVSDYRRRVLGAYNFKGVLASGSKGVRAYPVASRAEAGELLLVSGRWNTEFIDELCSFSQGPHDDQVDALAGAFAHLASASHRTYNMKIPILSRPSHWHIDGYST